MSAEARRRMGADLAPLDLAWQAWRFQHLSFDLRGRRGAFGTAIGVSGSAATNGDRWICCDCRDLLILQHRTGWQATYTDPAGKKSASRFVELIGLVVDIYL